MSLSVGASAYTDTCGDSSNSSSSAHARLSEDQFSSAKASIASYQASSCDSSSDLDSSSSSVQDLSNFIEPKVYEAYKNCLETFKAGIRWSSDFAIDQRSVSIDLRYVPSEGVTDPARMFGIRYSDAFATCTLRSAEGGHTAGAFKTVQIACSLN
jgi:hypothetical protein